MGNSWFYGMSEEQACIDMCASTEPPPDVGCNEAEQAAAEAACDILFDPENGRFWVSAK